MCGCFSHDYPASANKLVRSENLRLAKILTFKLPGEIAPDRPALFICPECGDLGYGAIAYKLTRAGGKARWPDFAYQNNFNEACSGLRKLRWHRSVRIRA